MMSVIGAEHEFHDPAFVAGWANRFAPTPARIGLFNVILQQLQSLVSDDALVVELGTGPGYLADHLLQAMPALRYIGVDFSAPMLEIARTRLAAYAARVTYVQTDLIHDAWWTQLPPAVDAVVSTWALHDLGRPEHVEQVYKNSARVLGNGGLLLNGDFIKPDAAIFEYEAGRFEIDRHLAMLRRSGFSDVECLSIFETEIEAPTAAQNYACLKGVVGETIWRHGRDRG